MPDAGELLLSFNQPCIAARAGARADIAHVHHELERLRVHLVDQPVEPLDLGIGVGRIAQHAERELARRHRRKWRAAG